MSGATNHEVAWVSAGLCQAAADLGVELPAGYALTVAAQALRRGEEVGVTRLGPGVILSSPPSEEHPMPFVVGYAEAGCQWYRDGRHHCPSPEPTGVSGTDMAALGALGL